MCRCKVHWTPATEVWPNVFIGNEETAMDRARLKEMNTAAYKEYLQGKIDTRAEYYKEMNIAYCGVLVNDEHRFDISKDLFPASEFIHKAQPPDKFLVHCSATLFLAYLMIHHEILLEDAIDHVIDKRWIRPNRDFLKQLTILNSNLRSQQILLTHSIAKEAVGAYGHVQQLCLLRIPNVHQHEPQVMLKDRIGPAHTVTNALGGGFLHRFIARSVVEHIFLNNLGFRPAVSSLGRS
ncbi:dual specificity phosphatase 29-like [Onychostoma macrolepis]|uniref:dual specificity phosphatase 29-like n=1 Tax=Onychostoma macrolepis TaxID=369639 RepID=UPI00272A5097|nr:dual specificity phosphatase 29-like [Onychostoma macrolepis]